MDAFKVNGLVFQFFFFLQTSIQIYKKNTIFFLKFCHRVQRKCQIFKYFWKLFQNNSNFKLSFSCPNLLKKKKKIQFFSWNFVTKCRGHVKFLNIFENLFKIIQTLNCHSHIHIYKKIQFFSWNFVTECRGHVKF